MPAVSVPQAFQLALQHHQAGRLAEAEALYRQVLAVQPDHASAWHMLGVATRQSGLLSLAEEQIRRAISLDPHNAAAHCNLGEAYGAMGRFDDAIACYRRALELKPDSPEAINNLGTALKATGNMGEAIAAYRRALTIKPDYPDASMNLGIALAVRGEFEEAVAAFRAVPQIAPAHAKAYDHLGSAFLARGRFDEAADAYRRALEINPEYATAHFNLGIALKELGQLEQSIGAFRQAIELKPDFTAAFINLANVLTAHGRIDEAIAAARAAIDRQPGSAEACINLGIALAAQLRLDEAVAVFRRAVDLNPNSADAHHNLGSALLDCGQLDEASVEIQRAIEREPGHAGAWDNFGNVLRGQGRLEEALAAYRRATEAAPATSRFHSSILVTLQLLPHLEERRVIEEHQQWNRQISGRVRQVLPPHLHDRNPDRGLRVGYVSPDFRDLAVGRNLKPLFQHHEFQNFTVLCYSGAVQTDGLTEEFRQRAEAWRNTVGMTDQALADTIRRDGVDILVDLAQHTRGNRLPVFARNPAPVQVSFMGYPASTGLEAIGYRISDRWLDAEFGVGSSDFGWKRNPNIRPPNFDPPPAEQVFLIDSFWCYDPCGVEVAVTDLPAKESRRITFGSLNNFCKINDFVLKLWARVLMEAPDSRLLLLSEIGGHRQRALDFLEHEGVEPNRVEFVAPCPRRAYLEQYQRIDIALDPFPYGGHTTSLDALWMGAPVVSLAGERAVSRAGLSILNNLGLPELVAFSEEDYVKVAVELAGDLPRIEELRRTLRSRMEASILMDAPQFARNIETAYRAMWRCWCAAESAS